MSLGASALGATALGAGPVREVMDVIEKTELMPRDAKEAIKDYIKETVNELWQTIDELIQLEPPPELLEYWQIFINLLSNLL